MVVLLWRCHLFVFFSLLEKIVIFFSSLISQRRLRWLRLLSFSYFLCDGSYHRLLWWFCYIKGDGSKLSPFFSMPKKKTTAHRYRRLLQWVFLCLKKQRQGQWPSSSFSCCCEENNNSYYHHNLLHLLFFVREEEDDDILFFFFFLFEKRKRTMTTCYNLFF